MNYRYSYYLKLLFIIAVAISVARCSGEEESEEELVLPEGFESTVVVDSIGPARHLAVNDNGDIYAKLKESYDDGSIVALRDTTGDEQADVIRKFGVFEDEGGFHTGAKIREGHLYVSTDLTVYRYELTPGKLVPEGEPDTLVVDDHEHGTHEHITKPIAFDGQENMYVPFGAPNNACQEPKRTPGVEGQDPCPVLEDHGGVWQFDKEGLNQTQNDGVKYASGLRSVVAIDWHPVDDNLYIVVHGRDNLHRLWPNIYSPWENAMLPAEEFVRVTEGSHFGWPYCYYDQLKGEKVLAPEYGGDGEEIGRCGQYDDPVIGFPGHFAPNDLMFYQGDQFPDHYRNGAFVAFHGSTIRDPYPQAGYFVAFVPFEGNGQFGEWEVFANGFAGVDTIESTSDAKHRPSGLATGPDGSLYVTGDNEGKIWKIEYTGDRSSFGENHLARVREEKKTANNIRTPDEEEDIIQEDVLMAGEGEEIYNSYCAACHQRDGKGAPPRYPPLSETEWVTGDKSQLISVILNGLEGSIEVKGETYDSAMPQHDFLSNEEVAKVATYVRQNFGNNASPVTEEEVSQIRENSDN